MQVYHDGWMLSNGVTLVEGLLTLASETENYRQVGGCGGSRRYIAVLLFKASIESIELIQE